MLSSVLLFVTGGRRVLLATSVPSLSSSTKPGNAGKNLIVGLAPWKRLCVVVMELNVIPMTKHQTRRIDSTSRHPELSWRPAGPG
jgi:hypothetical protein